MFNQDSLREKLAGIDCVIYGEAYGGKEQGMSATYGKQMKFVAFDVKINDCWLAVPQAAEFVESLGLEFVYYEKISTDINEINRCEDEHIPAQAIRNGMGPGRKEGVVLRPLIELTTNNGQRLICKHKGDDFKETKTTREISPEQLVILSDAQAIASEWVTEQPIQHMLDKIPGAGMEKMKEIMTAMMEDIERESVGEVVLSKEARSAIGKATALGVKKLLSSSISRKGVVYRQI